MQRKNADGLVTNEAAEIMVNPVLRWTVALPPPGPLDGHILLQIQTPPAEPGRAPEESYRLGKAPEDVCYLLNSALARKMMGDLARYLAQIEKEGSRPPEH